MKLILVAVVLVLMHGCVSQHQAAAPVEMESQASAVDQYAEVYARLEAVHEHWKGVPYRYGGLDKSGVDCSGFVYLTFREQFSLPLPRTTRALAQVGQVVAKQDIKPGDLVFFKTRSSGRHVGIAMGDNKFLHASTKQGIKISSLDNTYWAARYWKAVRVPT